MLNTITIREGRYTGPSLQATPEQGARLAKLISAPIAPQKSTPRTWAMIDAERNADALADLLAAGGIVAFGAWQTGAGNYKKSREVPLGAVVWSKSDTESYQYTENTSVKPPRAPAHICAWFAAHPRAQRCVAIKE